MIEPYWQDDTCSLYLGDSRTVLAEMPDSSVDAVVTDPPAGVSFMGRDWDSDRGGRDKWIAWLADRMEQAFRVLKPGGHALVWALPRTSHWTAMALEDAGFQIRDCVLHIFGSGFPKSLDVGKAIDKAERGGMVRAKLLHFAEVRGIDGRWLEERGVASAASFADWTVGGHVPSDRNWQIVKVALGITADEEAAYEREVIGERAVAVDQWTAKGRVALARGESLYAIPITVPATDDARRWSGWGTALKPGQEIWWLARKPLEGSVAGNVLAHGTGALNIEGCRTATHSDGPGTTPRSSVDGRRSSMAGPMDRIAYDSEKGRWPTNVALTHSADCTEACAADCPVAELDRQSGVLTSGTGAVKRASAKGGTRSTSIGAESRPAGSEMISYGDSGGASCYFPVFRYEAKAPASERPKLPDGTAWPTVKPLDLMRFLVRLVTPPGGLVLDLFAGSGTTGEACVIEGFRCLLVDQDPVAAELIKTRLSKPIQPTLGEAS